jgi:hypothetical protein
MGSGGGDSTTEADPHCKGFGGEMFDFTGEDGKYYNMMSTGTLQVNVRVKAISPYAPQFTFMDEIAIKIGSKSVGLSHVIMGLNIDEWEFPEVFLDMHKVSKNTITYIYTGLKDRCQNKVLGYIHILKNKLVINSGNFTIRIYRMSTHPEMVNIPHLDMSFKATTLGVLSDGIMPHGVLGQTVDQERIKPKGALPKNIKENVYWLHEGENDKFMNQYGFGVIDGHYKDYEVSTPFGDDFKFNRFGTIPTKHPVFNKLSGVVPFL